MWFGNVQVPDELLAAQRDDRLVVFAGAGVSMAPPTRLPSFDDIAKTIETQFEVRRRVREPIDSFLGRVEDASFDVRTRVEEMITSSQTENRLHQAVVSLFRSSSLQVVTTNYDRLLSKAAEAHGSAPIREYIAPALPPGDDFSGVVYLHGAVGEERRHMVLTDRDFGAAYLTRGYARRFLMELFSTRVVLFVGYSHRDPVLTYLARGLPPRAQPRYALVQPKDADRWIALSVEPIPYQVRRGQARHFAIVAPLLEWRRYTEMGFADHRRQIHEIAALGPGGDRPSMDYIRARIRDPDTVTFFCEAAVSTDWLEWIAGESVFQELFAGGALAVWTEVHAALSEWFADRFVSDYPSQALGMIARLRAAVSAPLWYAIARRLWIHRPPSEQLAAWLPILFQSAPPRTMDLLDYLLDKSRPDADDQCAVMLFDYLTEPQAAMMSIPGAFSADGRSDVRVEVNVRGDDHYWLHESLSKIFIPRLERFARPLLDIVTKHLTKARALEEVSGQVGDDWDTTSFHMVEGDAETIPGLLDWRDLLIKAGRTALVWIASHDVELASSFVLQWLTSDALALRRLAVHVVAVTSLLDADARLTLIIERGLLFAPATHPEVVTLLGEAYAAASPETQRALLREIEREPTSARPRSEPEMAARMRYQLLSAISEASPDDEALRARLDLLVQMYPKVIGLAAVQGAGEQASPLMNIDEVRKHDLADAAFIELLIAFGSEDTPDDRAFDRPRDSVLRIVTAVASEDLAWGLGLADVLRSRSEWATDLWGALTEAWSESIMSDEQWGQVLDILIAMPEKSRHADHIARLLESAVRASPPLIPVAQVHRAEQLASETWLSLAAKSGDARVEPPDDWLERAINHPAGRLSMFFLHALSLSHTRDAGPLDVVHREQFAEMTGGASALHGMGLAVFASQLHFLFALDRDWCAEALIPFMDWSRDEAKARQAWDGFLSWGRLSPGLVDALLPVYESSFDHIAQLARLRDRFNEHLAIVAFLTSVNPVANGWLLKFVLKAEATDTAAWAAFVAGQLRKMDDASRRAAWDSWLRGYWRRRIQGNPRVLSEGESKVMAEWPLVLPPVFDDAVAAVCEAQAFGADVLFYHALSQGDLPERHPGSVAALLAHILSGQRRDDFWSCDDVVDVSKRVVALASIPAELRGRLVDQLARLHCNGID